MNILKKIAPLLLCIYFLISTTIIYNLISGVIPINPERWSQQFPVMMASLILAGLSPLIISVVVAMIVAIIIVIVAFASAGLGSIIHYMAKSKQ